MATYGVGLLGGHNLNHMPSSDFTFKRERVGPLWVGALRLFTRVGDHALQTRKWSCDVISQTNLWHC